MQSRPGAQTAPCRSPLGAPPPQPICRFTLPPALVFPRGGPRSGAARRASLAAIVMLARLGLTIQGLNHKDALNKEIHVSRLQTAADKRTYAPHS
eukprot:scaffold15157_cov27-Tisochrysis_lutea.AAC.3